MHIAIPKETKAQEYRVALVPSAVRELSRRGHTVFVETRAGEGVGESDEAYERAGASIVQNSEELFSRGELIVKVKEPQPDERKKLRPQHVLFAFLHLAADPNQTRDLLDSGSTCIAFETITSASGKLPLLLPMSEIAGRLAVQAGAACLEKRNGGSGVLLAGAPGVSPATVLILGAGSVGLNATAIAVGMGADVIVMDRSVDALRMAAHLFGWRIKTVVSGEQNLFDNICMADLVIGGVLIPGGAAPKLITRDHLKSMRPGSAFVDVAVDQGGCAETTRATTHSDPIYVEHGIVHYCVANMPSAVSRTSAAALSNAILPYVMALADLGWRKALRIDANMLNGLNVCQGEVTYPAVARDLGLPHTEAYDLVSQD